MPAPKGSQRQNGLGQFSGSKGLTEMQRAFVAAYVRNGGDGTAAAEAAGYAYPKQAAYELQRNPAIQEAIRSENVRRLEGKGVSLATTFLIDVLEDENASDKVRLEAAKTVLDRAGVTAHKPQGSEGTGQKDLADMSQAELQRFIAEQEQALAKLKDITPQAVDVAPGATPDNPPSSPKLLEYKGTQQSESN